MNMNVKFKDSLKNIQNPFQKNIFDMSYNWDFKRCLKSVDMDSELFVNYFSNKKDNLYKFVKSEYTWLINNQDNVFERFELKPLFDTKFYDRLRNIAYETSHIRYGYINSVARLKHNENGAFQLYYMVQNNTIIFLVIDIYHLLIPAPDYTYGKPVKNPSEDYYSNKGKRFGLEELKSITKST